MFVFVRAAEAVLSSDSFIDFRLYCFPSGVVVRFCVVGTEVCLGDRRSVSATDRESHLYQEAVLVVSV